MQSLEAIQWATACAESGKSGHAEDAPQTPEKKPTKTNHMRTSAGKEEANGGGATHVEAHARRHNHLGTKHD